VTLQFTSMSNEDPENVVQKYYTVSQKTSPTILAITRESIVGFL